MDDEVLRLCVLHAHVFDLQRLRFLLESTAAERVERQAKEIVLVRKENDHHAPLRVRRTFTRDRQTVVFGVDVWIGVCHVEWGGYDFAELEVAARIIRNLAHAVLEGLPCCTVGGLAGRVGLPPLGRHCRWCRSDRRVVRASFAPILGIWPPDVHVVDLRCHVGGCRWRGHHD